MVGLYSVLGLGAIGALCWLLMQITARQRRLSAELVRLERLAAEVAMSAEAVLDKVDERVEHLDKLLATAEARVAEATAAPAPVAEEPPAAEAPAPKKRTRKKKESAPVAEPPVAEAPAPVDQTPPPASPTPIARYQELRTAVWALADQGRSTGDIAQELGVPRGEVQLMLNLRTKKVTA